MDENTGWSPELGVLRIAAPCRARWEEMKGDGQVRFCAACKLNVYDLSAMRSDEARALLLEREGRLCVRFFRRPDGRVLTQDCPKGLGARLARKWAAAIAAVGGLFALMGLGALQTESRVGGVASSSPPPPIPIPHAAQKPAAQPPDEKWMQQRRERTGDRVQMERYPIMGVIRHQIVQIKGGDGKKI
ncbi:MAG: hypothetical protein QM723_31730 [Myxococcaceae bacterium]